ncbi:MAG: TIGR03750 family conjugal transfer protein [Cycloclasticus sp.]|nr:TIGR03750 family conjugal transfer protein [Cycloclasticus sp.]MBG96989.1 TIGR03750 family conjugal transfer protein [Cycloclasticus sp.]
MESQQDNELLPVRLNAEPSIFRGCSLSELMLLVTVGGIALVPGSVIVCGLFGYLMMGVGIGLLLVIVWVVIGATVLQKLKRGRPLGYYQLRLRLWLEDLHLLRSSFIRQSRVWDVGRRLKWKVR